MQKSKKAWRVFYTLPRMEKVIEDQLRERQVEVFLPKCVEVHQWSDRKKEVVEPLFRNYIFAHVEEAERLRVLQARGIVRCVSFGGCLAEVAAHEIRQLQIMQQMPDRLSLQRTPLPALRTPVTVERGPLAGLVGEVLEHRGQMQLVVQIHSIRQAVKVLISAHWVRANSAVASI